MAATNPIRAIYLAGATGAQVPLSVDWRDNVPSGYSFEVQFNAGATGSVTIESTLDDLNDPSITADWIAETVAITADTRGVIGHPVTALRLNISSLAGGSLTLKLLGGSVIGDVSGLVAPGGGGGPSSNVNLVATGSNALAVDDAPAGTTAPVPVGGIHLTTSPAYTNGDRTQWQSGAAGLLMGTIGRRGAYADAVLNTNIVWPFGYDDGRTAGGSALAVANTVFNGTSWDRQRGDTTGTYVVGNVASGVADAGNPVKVGGMVGATGGLGPYSVGQRSDLWLSLNGAPVISGITQTGVDALANGSLMSLAATNSTGVRLLMAAPSVFNGTSWDRQRGDTNGTYVGGNVASGVADAGNPVKVGGVYTNAPVAAAVGSRTNLLTGPYGVLAVASGNSSVATDGFSNTLAFGLGLNDNIGSRLNGTGGFGFNGTTWDRLRMNPAASGGAALVEVGPYVFGRVTADGQIKGSAGFIHTITISPNGTVVAGVLTIYNSLTETGAVVAQFALPVTTFTPFSVTLDVACGTGIFVGFDATLANVSCTVSYR